MLASCLERERRFDDAIAVYERITSPEHRSAALAGKATALLAAGRGDAALAALDAGDQGDADILECRIRVLDQLGRSEEAAATLQRFIALADKRSDLRVRAAQLARSFSSSAT